MRHYTRAIGSRLRLAATALATGRVYSGNDLDRLQQASQRRAEHAERKVAVLAERVEVLKGLLGASREATRQKAAHLEEANARLMRERSGRR